MIYDRLEANALARVFGDAFPSIPVHSIKSMLGQHGAGSSALQAVTACLSIRRGAYPPTINHDEPDPDCGPIRVTHQEEPFPVGPALVHCIGLGGFYYSAATFAPPEDRQFHKTGAMQVQWSKDKHPRFQPAEEFQKPLSPWAPRREE